MPSSHPRPDARKSPLPWKIAPRHFLHGGDYNPEQWAPEVWEEDVRLMRKAGVNVVSLGIFAWSHLEPEEGRYEFAWLDRIIGLLEKNGVSIMLATPSGARPPWLAQRYPEVLRVNDQGIRNLYGQRHNHCFTSPVYREKVAAINGRLAERYGARDSVILWHISNEYSGDCHCDLCQEAFRGWLRQRYDTLDRLNAAWWSSFWSHRYTAWEQISAPSPRGETLLHGQVLAWKRFISDQTISFYDAEVAAIRAHDRLTPATTNFMDTYVELDYFSFARHVDIVSWDSYPKWHRDPASEADVAADTAFHHDLIRSMRGSEPFLLMESTPSQVNWQPVNKLKRPGMHRLASLQAVAHGADSVQYFQWRKSRGSAEKFHGAVVDHHGGEQTRVFGEVAALGEALSRLDAVRGSRVRAEAAVLCDSPNRWALNQSQGMRNDRKDYLDEVMRYHRAFWDRSVSVDCIDQTCPLDGYKLVVAPMLYLLRPGFADRAKAFVRQGGTLVTTHCTGLVDEDDLVFTGGLPGPLRELLGLWIEETDALYDGQTVPVRPVQNGGSGEVPLHLQEGYRARDICERIHLDTALPLAVYGAEFYAGEPCLTENRFGQGRAFHVAFRAEAAFIGDFLGSLVAASGIESNWSLPLPPGVNVQKRSTEGGDYRFLLNFTPHEVTVPLPSSGHFVDEITRNAIAGPLHLPAYGSTVLRVAAVPHEAHANGVHRPPHPAKAALATAAS
ncbi:beta-galactosidase [Verrucomicrobium sp. GAS474]|uniref:beta-galactosidase n=1 Tax=Verrucomicrobium sp. GAS474 TaxID=1882831 RepID=UPI00087C9AFB|nr:beta-galactosidase [Verrucomicrobium sp. GAS474]SDT92876.1 beta-galactosidase [Verrucomicrobium sp. GAS474]